MEVQNVFLGLHTVYSPCVPKTIKQCIKAIDLVYLDANSPSFPASDTSYVSALQAKFTFIQPALAIGLGTSIHTLKKRNTQVRPLSLQSDINKSQKV